MCLFKVEKDGKKMTLEDLLIRINEDKELKENTLTVVVMQKEDAILRLHEKGIEKYWEYLTDDLLIKKIEYIHGYVTVVKILEDQK